MKTSRDSKDKGNRAVSLTPLQYDVSLLFSVLFLVGIGIVAVYSASSALALEKFGTDTYFLKKQALYSSLGMIALVVCSHVPYRILRPLTYPILVVALLFLTTVLVTPHGITAGGATRWLRLGGLSFQPSEFARFALVIYLAYSLSKKNETGNIKEFSVGFLPHVLVLGIIAALIFLQPDFGSVIILGAIAWFMMFAGGVRIVHLLLPLIILLPILGVMLITAPYRLQRLIAFLDPWQYPTEGGYQIIHSLMAFGTGGLWGIGVGKGYQKLFYLPEPHTDFIFSVIGEEFGFFGVSIILGLYFLIVWRGIIIASNAGDTFGMFVALGLTTALGFQVCINMGVSLGLLPTKGLTLPFLSYGGTSLLINMAAIGILMNIAASSRRKKVSRGSNP
ncbi:putative lipid II flippase FtsW [Thermodesulfobacteriota bacterium]